MLYAAGNCLRRTSTRRARLILKVDWVPWGLSIADLLLLSKRVLDQLDGQSWPRFDGVRRQPVPRNRSSFSTRKCLAIGTSVSPQRMVYCASLRCFLPFDRLETLSSSLPFTVDRLLRVIWPLRNSLSCF